MHVIFKVSLNIKSMVAIFLFVFIATVVDVENWLAEVVNLRIWLTEAAVTKNWVVETVGL